MKRRMTAVTLGLVLVLGSCALPARAAGVPKVSARAAVLIDGITGRVLMEKNAREPRAMASTTKLMTALLAAESDRWEQEITVTAAMTAVEGTSMGLRPGDRVTVGDLCAGMLLASGNDAANAVALTLADSLPAFAAQMNARADRLGMSRTNFVTPSGLDAEGHFSTALDMALLGRAVVQNGRLAPLCAARTVQASFGDPPTVITLTNHNKLLSSYDGAVGLKTGFTKKAGRCLVSAARREGALLVAVTLSAPDDWNDHKKLLDYGFSLYDEQPLDSDFAALRLPVTGGRAAAVGVLGDRLSHRLLPGQAAQVVRTLRLPPFVYAPVAFGDKVGEAVYTLEGVEIARQPLLAAWDVPLPDPPPPRPGFWASLLTLLRRL